MKVRPSSVAALALWLVFALGAGLGISLDVANKRAEDLPEVIPFLVSFASFATVGLMVATRRPKNPIGWMFLAIGVLTGLGALSEGFVGQSFRPTERLPALALVSAWVHLWFWYPLFGLATVFTLLLFPSGLPSRRWRPLLWLSILVISTVTIAAALSSTLDVAGRRIPNPIGLFDLTLDALEQGPLITTLFGAIAVIIPISLSSLVVRFRRARGEERRQLKWFVYSAALLALSLIPSAVFPTYDQSAASTVVSGLALSFLPLSIGIAILRYRLYAIDLIINRTLVYGTLTVMLAGVYFAAVALLQSSFRAFTGQATPLAIVLSTLAIAAAFSPLRRRIQAFIDHRFYRSKYDAQQALAAFGTTARDEVEIEALAQALVGTVDEAMRPATLSLWIRENR